MVGGFERSGEDDQQFFFMWPKGIGLLHFFKKVFRYSFLKYYFISEGNISETKNNQLAFILKNKP